MKLEDIKIGEVFTINNTPSYPKLRTSEGWVDIRDKIYHTSNSNDESHNYDKLNFNEVAKSLGASDENLIEYCKDLLNV